LDVVDVNEGGKGRKMLVVTGTALTKNTPVAVLEKLECAERSSPPQQEPTGLAEHVREGEAGSAPEALAQPDLTSADQR
jgi:hypothetical protein